MFIIGTGVGGGIIANGQLVRGVHFTAGEYSFVNTNADEWENTEKTMACQCSTKYLLKWYRARKGLPADAPMNGKLFLMPPMPPSRKRWKCWNGSARWWPCRSTT